MHATTAAQRLRINGPEATFHAHEDARFERVAHVYHLEWHGIRSATSCLPGHKIGIAADVGIDGDTIRRIMGFVYEHGIRAIVFQGYSSNADILARALHRLFQGTVAQFVVTHVTSTQFEYYFEVEQQKRIATCLEDKVLSGVASVKPRFRDVMPIYWPGTIFNAPPALPDAPTIGTSPSNIVFVPLENTLRKNLYTNVIAALNARNTDLVWSVNNPSGLEDLIKLSRLRVIGYQRGPQLYDRMAEASVVLNCTLAECQPMTQLEALAVGTPCLTGPLGLDELADHPLTRLLEVGQVDAPHRITEALDVLIEKTRANGESFRSELRDYLAFRVRLALDSLAAFVLR